MYLAPCGIASAAEPAPGRIAGSSDDTSAVQPGGVKLKAVAVRRLGTSLAYCPDLHADGVANDTAPLQACKTDAPAQSIVRLPPGDLRVTALPTGPIATLWQLDGTTFNGGSPITALGTDVIESVLDGGKYFSRGLTLAGQSPVVRTDLTVTHTGGVPGRVVNAEHVNCTIPPRGAALTDYIWCNATVLSSSAFGPGQHVGISALAVRPPDALADGRGARAQTWAGYFENNDQTAADSDRAGSQVGIEDDIYAGGGDPSNHRINLQINIATSGKNDSPARVGRAIAIGRNDAASFYGTPIEISAPFDTAGIDLRRAAAMGGAPAIRLSGGQAIDFSGDAGHRLEYMPSEAMLVWIAQGLPALKLDDGGNATLRGSLAATSATVSGAETVGGTLTRGPQISNALVSYDVADGFDATIACGTDIAVLQARGTISGGKVDLCPSPVNGQYVTILSEPTISNIRFSVKVIGAPDAVGPTTPFRLIWVAAASAWFRAL